MLQFMIHAGILGSISKTGKNSADKVYNIYDLEGNLYEYTAEKSYFSAINHFIYRGSCYEGKRSASNRFDGEGYSHFAHGFRICLYVF